MEKVRQRGKEKDIENEQWMRKRYRDGKWKRDESKKKDGREKRERERERERERIVMMKKKRLERF